MKIVWIAVTALLLAGCRTHGHDSVSDDESNASTHADAVAMTVAGDSLALGIGASDSSRGFAFDLYRRIARAHPGSEVTNLAIGGTTSPDVERLEIPRVAATHPDIVLLEVGANDAVRRRSAVDFARTYASLVRATRRAAPRSRLVLFNVPDVAVSAIFDDGSKPALRRLVAAYNVTVAKAARESGATLVDLYAISDRARGGGADRFFSSDLFHPSDAGHEAIAAAAWPAVERSVSGIRAKRRAAQVPPRLARKWRA